MVLPPTGSAPPETAPPNIGPVPAPPPGVPSVSSAPIAAPVSLPSVPSVNPAAAPSPAPAPDLPPTAAAAPVPPSAEPLVSQPMRPAAPGTVSEAEKKREEEGIYFNVADEEIGEVVKQISRALGKNFLLDGKLRGKITIISEKKMTKDEVWEAFQSALDVLGFTIVDGPAGLLRVVAKRDALSNPIALYTEKSPFSDRFITRLITLENISAVDMANVIKGLVSKEGNLFAYPATNTLILSDSGTNIDRLIRLMSQLDKEGPQEVLEMIPVVYADAKELAAKITDIFETEEDTQNGSSPRRRGGRAPTGEELAEIPRLRKVIPDERTNSLIVLASKMAIKKVRQMIKKLDAPMAEEGEIHVYYLKHANAKEMTTVLNAVAGQVSQNQDKQASPAGRGGASQPGSVVGGAEISGKFSVTADETTNALIIVASSKDYNTLVDQVISPLDIPRRQVYVEAVIVELSIEENQQLGMGILAGKNFNVGGANLAAFGSTFGFLDISRLLGGTAGAADTANTININLPGAPGAGAGTTSSMAVPAFFAALQFAQRNSNVNILSTPNILTLDNQEAEIKVGQKIYQPQAQATTIGGSLQTSFVGEDVALSLKIKPQITEGGSIRMEVAQEDREALPPIQIGSGVSPIPTTLRQIKTAIVAKNGQTVVLGGLIKDKYTTTVNKVPILGDIPILGYLFKTRQKEKRKVNLIVFMTPNIIREPRDFLALLQRKINEQNSFVDQNFTKREQKQIHQSLETHASYLLRAVEEPVPLTEEERFPMEIPEPAKKKAATPPESQVDTAY